MSLLSTYKKYTDTGLDWIGELPEHWTLIKGQFIFKVINERSKKGEELLLSVSEKKGVTPRSEADVTMFMAESYQGYKLCQPGDLVINSLWAWSNGLGFSEYHGIVSTAYSVFRPNHKDYDYRYLHYLLKTSRYVGQYSIHSKGIWTSRLQLSDWSFLRLPIISPPREEQTTIAKFLDHKTEEIKKFIALKEHTIELLRERKAAIINQAVTKGLNPSVEMKDSGIDWLGKIPKHWEVKKLKHVTKKVGSGITPTGGAAVYSETGIPLLRSQNVHFDGLVLEDVARITPEVHRSMSNSQVLTGDVLLNITGGSLGRCYFVDSSLGEANVNQHVCIVRPTKAIISEFLNYLLSSEAGQAQIWFFQKGGGREGLNFQNLKGFYFAIPTPTEQSGIIDSIKTQLAPINKIIRETEKEIQIAQEYCQSLISEAVTGKIDVRTKILVHG